MILGRAILWRRLYEEKGMKKKVLLLCQQRGCRIELSPARYQLIYELHELGYEVSVFVSETISSKQIRSKIDHIVNTKYLTMKEIRKEMIKREPQYVITFTYEDAQIAYALPGIMKKAAFIYFNLEIYVPDMEWYLTENRGLISDTCCWKRYFCNKLREILYTKQCRFFVIQDMLRKKTSKKYFIAHPRTLLIPNSYVLSDEYQLENRSEGIIYSGGVNKLQAETLIKKLDTLSNIPITLAGWSDGYFRQQYKKIRETYPNIKVYDQILPPEKLSDFLRQYAVGLIWYSPVKDENVNNIGLASGKLFKHLSIGQPVITVDCPGVSSVVKKYRLGLVIHEVSEMKSAYEHIMKHYSYYQENVKRVYKERYDYRKVIQPFLTELEAMNE